jgi:CBS domain-containing protein
MKIYEFMTTRIEYIDAEQSVYDAIERMVDRRIRSLVVKFEGVDKSPGVITARDVVFKVIAKGLNPREIKLWKIASRPLLCLDKNEELENAAALMEQSNITRVYVCDGPKIIGVVSLLDTLAASLIARARGDHDH